MQKIMTKCAYSYCPRCGSNAVNCYDINNKRISYDILLNRFKEDEVLKKLDTITISYMMCSKCNRKSIVDWTLGLPRASDRDINHIIKTLF